MLTHILFAGMNINVAYIMWI